MAPGLVPVLALALVPEQVQALALVLERVQVLALVLERVQVLALELPLGLEPKLVPRRALAQALRPELALALPRGSKNR